MGILVLVGMGIWTSYISNFAIVEIRDFTEGVTETVTSHFHFLSLFLIRFFELPTFSQVYTKNKQFEKSSFESLRVNFANPDQLKSQIESRILVLVASESPGRSTMRGSVPVMNGSDAKL